MNATKNELQHNTMLHYYIGTTVNGAKGIAHTVKANPLWIVAMLVMAWLAYSVQDMRATESMGSIGHLMTVLQSVEMLAVAAIALVVVCYRIGSVTGAKQMYQDLLRGGIVNSAGEAPLLVERKRIDGEQENCLLTFKIKGLPLERWKDLSPTIAASLGVYVVEIKEGAEPYTYTVHTVANDALPTRIDWSPSIIPDRSTKFALGEAVTGTVYADIQNDPGILTASATGGGKTMETKGIAAQALYRDYILIVADYKYVEYGGIWGSKGTYIVHDDENLLWVMQRLIERLHDRRDWLAEHDCRNIDDYNERYPDNKLRRVMLLIDEAAIALDTRTQNKAKKAARQEIVEAINELACTGRFVGFSFLISLQRPSAEVLSGELRNNLTIRLVGKSDANLSMLALDNADAAKLIPSDTPGRFLTSNGEILQGYYFEDTMLRNLPDKRSPAWETKMSSKSKTLSAVGYASADIFLQVIRENMTPKMVAEAQELSKNTDGLALVYTISREDIDGAGVWREEKVYQYRNSDGGKCILMIGSGGEHTVWHIATADGYQPGSGCLLMTVQESLFYKTTVFKLRTDDPFIWG